MAAGSFMTLMLGRITCSAGMAAGCAQNLVLLRTKVSGGTQAASSDEMPLGAAIAGSAEGLTPALQPHMFAIL